MKKQIIFIMLIIVSILFVGCDIIKGLQYEIVTTDNKTLNCSTIDSYRKNPVGINCNDGYDHNDVVKYRLIDR